VATVVPSRNPPTAPGGASGRASATPSSVRMAATGGISGLPGCSESTFATTARRWGRDDQIGEGRPGRSKNCRPKPEHHSFQELGFSRRVLEMQRQLRFPRRAAAGSTCCRFVLVFCRDRRALALMGPRVTFLILGSRTVFESFLAQLLAEGPCAASPPC